MLGASFARLLAFPYNIVLFTVILMDLLLLKYPGPLVLLLRGL